MHQKKHTLATRTALPALCIALIAGCTSEKKDAAAPTPPPAPAHEVTLAERLLASGRLQDATIAAVDIARKNPQAAGLPDLQYRIAKQLADERLATATQRSVPTLNASTADAKAFGIIPERYRTQRHVMGETESLATAPTIMQEVLQRTVSINLSNADLPSIISLIGETQAINMIADANAGIDPDSGNPLRVSIYAEDTPLIEILEYLGRNLAVTFSVGNNLIWVTPKPADEPAGPPLETRIYRLRKGMLGSELGKSVSGMTPFRGATSSSNSGGQQQQQQEQPEQQEGAIGLLESIERFVPQPDGADFLFNDKAHVLIVKNTRENLALAENLIEALDVRALQVLIEARFITTAVSDLRDLGIEWLLDNRKYPRLADPAAISGPNTMPNLMQFTRHALTASSGATGGALAYQFVLGDTALEAVLHALEENGESKTIVSPRVTTANNREASFRVGEDTTYFDDVTTQISSTTGYGNSNSRDATFNYNRPSTLETGYSLIVTPSVGADLSTINLVLRPEISAVKEWKKYIISTTSYEGQDGGEQQPSIEIPTITRQYIETEVIIRSGETIILGGLVNTLKQETTKGTPWLSRLPLLGYLFKTEDKKETYDNILIFVTATVISDIGEELIPLNELERYGLEVPDDAKIPDVIKNPPPLEEPAGESETDDEADAKSEAEREGEDAPGADLAPAPEADPAPAEPALAAAPEPAPAAEAPAEPAPAAVPEPAPAPAPAAPAPAALPAGLFGDPAPAPAPGAAEEPVPAPAAAPAPAPAAAP